MAYRSQALTADPAVRDGTRVGRGPGAHPVPFGLTPPQLPPERPPEIPQDEPPPGIAPDRIPVEEPPIPPDEITPPAEPEIPPPFAAV